MNMIYAGDLRITLQIARCCGMISWINNIIEGWMSWIMDFIKESNELSLAAQQNGNGIQKQQQLLHKKLAFTNCN